MFCCFSMNPQKLTWKWETNSTLRFVQNWVLFVAFNSEMVYFWTHFDKVLKNKSINNTYQKWIFLNLNTYNFTKLLAPKITKIFSFDNSKYLKVTLLNHLRRPKFHFLSKFHFLNNFAFTLKSVIGKSYLIEIIRIWHLYLHREK